MKLQAQAVPRREDRLSPLPLAGVLLAGSWAATPNMREARTQGSGPERGTGAYLSWVPIEQVCDVAEDDIHALISRMRIVNDERTTETPSTPPYHRAARELERLAGLVHEATRVEECAAEAAALRGQAGRPHRDHAVE